MVNEGRCKPKLVVNIEISKIGDLRERIEGQTKAVLAEVVAAYCAILEVSGNPL
ncbi:hypothetical protein E2C01_045173 [Portunus trituberculatus]|uniref:Uncharacterized protein n=1 Tax=Portunus trituberculatus TaxID=210409 RepID=A0A5B7G1C7_PORTR|nr:hypothetical protein [Portunus trituberculatus]